MAERREFACWCQSIGDDMWWRERAYIDHTVAQEIVRCEDCKYYEPHLYNNISCEMFMQLMNPDDFCSKGERRNDED